MAENATTDIAAGLVWRDISLDAGIADGTTWAVDTVLQGDLDKGSALRKAARSVGVRVLAAAFVGLAIFFATTALFTPVTGGPSTNDEAAFVFAATAALATIFVAPNVVGSYRNT